jgi:hypothetical protein
LKHPARAPQRFKVHHGSATEIGITPAASEIANASPFDRDRRSSEVTDIFFFYSAKDRERVRPIYEALTAVGFDIFWDLQIPAGKDWDTLIKEQLAEARSAIVFWSLASIASDNVRHEATVAKQQSKLVPVLLDPLRVEQFPMGLFNTQAARLHEWSGNDDDPEWKKLLFEIENKAMPAWAGRRMENLAGELRAESLRRKTAEAKEDSAEAQLRQEIQQQGQLRRDRERVQAETEAARAEAEAARAELAGVKEALDAATVHNSDMAGRLASAESLAASATKRFPLLALLVALGLGAGVAYVGQEAVWTKRAAQARKVAQDAETTAKADADLRVAELNALLLTEKKKRTFNNTYLIGSVIPPEQTFDTAEKCQASCTGDPRCKGFDYSLRRCRTYSTINALGSSSGWIAGRWD